MEFTTYKDIDTFITSKNRGQFDVKLNGKTHSFWLWKNEKQDYRPIGKRRNIGAYTIRDNKDIILIEEKSIVTLRKYLKRHLKIKGFKEEGLRESLSINPLNLSNDLIDKNIKLFLEDLLNNYGWRPLFSVRRSKREEADLYNTMKSNHFFIGDSSSYKNVYIMWFHTKNVVSDIWIHSLCQKNEFHVALTLYLKELSPDRIEQLKKSYETSFDKKINSCKWELQLTFIQNMFTDVSQKDVIDLLEMVLRYRY